LTPADVAEGWGVDLALHPTTTLRWEYRASKEAAARGVGVVLSGWGGDETIAYNGRGFFADLARRGRLIRLARELHARSKVHPVVFWGVRSKVILPLMPDWMLRVVRPGLVEPRANRALPGCLSPAVRAQMAAIEPEVRSGRERAGRRSQQQRLLELGHLSHRAESWADHGASVGIEYRFPVLDQRVVEFALGAPDWVFFKNGWKRYAFRRAMRGLVPDVAAWKKRKGDPAMVRGGGALFGPARQIHRLDVMARESHVREAGLIEYDRFIADFDRSTQGTSDLEGGSRPVNEGSSRATWLAFATGTLA
jgi:asparagine synthase (glutamine-hydrolysing)